MRKRPPHHTVQRGRLQNQAILIARHYTARVVKSRIIEADADRVIAAVDALIVLVAARPVTPAHVYRIDAAVRALIPRHPRGVAYLHVIDSRPGETRRVPEDTREAFLEIARKAPPEARCIGVALLAEGFIAAAMRGLAAAVLAAFKTPIPLSVFGTIDETCNWMVQVFRRAGAPIAHPRELTNAVKDLQRSLRVTRIEP